LLLKINIEKRVYRCQYICKDKNIYLYQINPLHK